MSSSYHKFLLFFAFFPFFSCRYQIVIISYFCPVSACRPVCPVAGALTSLYGLAWQAVAAWLFRGVADRARVCRFGVSWIGGRLPSSACRCCRFVSGLPCIGGGCSHPVAVCVSALQSVAVSGGLYRWQAVRLSNKCFVQVFDWPSGSVCQNFQPNLGNFQPNPKLFQPNPDRILIYFSTESWIGLLPRLALQDR